MIDDLDETIRQLLVKELPYRTGEIDISFDQPKREWSARVSKPTINLYLYDVRENNVLRQHQWERVREENGKVTQKRSHMRVDCFYMLTTWVPNHAEGEHRLLNDALMVLFRYPILSEELLEGEMKGQPYEVQARLAAHDRLTNPAELWSSLDNELRPSISYVVSVALNPWQEVTTPAARAFSLKPITPIPTTFSFDGMVRRIDDKSPLPGVRVEIKGRGLGTTTDDQGHYQLGELPGGQYTLVIWPSKGKAPIEVKKTLTYPVKAGDHDLEV